jgi:hypothetical protein
MKHSREKKSISGAFQTAGVKNLSWPLQGLKGRRRVGEHPSEHIKQRLFDLQSDSCSWQAGGMAADAKSKMNPATVALHRAGADLPGWI